MSKCSLVNDQALVAPQALQFCIRKLLTLWYNWIATDRTGFLSLEQSLAIAPPCSSLGHFWADLTVSDSKPKTQALTA